MGRPRAASTPQEDPGSGRGPHAKTTRPPCGLCGEARSRPAAHPDGGPFPQHMRLCHRCEDRWLDFQCRALELRRRAEEAVLGFRASGGKLSGGERRRINDGLALLVAFFFRGAYEEGFGTGKIREVFHFQTSVPLRILRRLEISGAVEPTTTTGSAPPSGRPGDHPSAAATWTITAAGEQEIARFFLLLNRIDADPSVMLDSTHLLDLRVRGAGEALGSGRRSEVGGPAAPAGGQEKAGGDEDLG